ncbi:MAG: ATP-binding protein, partial [Planctomycetota bacterium]
RVQGQQAQVEGLTKVTEAKELEEAISAGASELEMLIDIVSNLKIEDTTQRTEIIDNISGIYSSLNAVRATVKNRIKDLASVEGKAEFGSQMKLLNQAVINYLDVCDTPEKTEEYLSKLMIQVEELEGRFADFDEFVEELTAKREEVYNAFENRKLQLVEARNKKADSLMRSAERIIKGIRTKVDSMDEVKEIHGYFASDLMVEKVRDIVAQLTDIGDSVKADDVQSQLKTVREDSVRQLKDRKELFVDGENVIRFGNHSFSVNTQKLDLTIVNRDGEQFLHLTGTDFFEAITDEEFLATRDVWAQELVSENGDVYRAEYLAFQLLHVLGTDELPDRSEAAGMSDDALKALVQQFMGPRYAEGYVKGVHDADAALILRALLEMQSSIGLLRYHTQARARAHAFWHRYDDQERKGLIEAKLHGAGALTRVFDQTHGRDAYVSELRELLAPHFNGDGQVLLDHASDYLFEVLSDGQRGVISPEAAELHTGFSETLKKKGAAQELANTLEKVKEDPEAVFVLLTNWVRAYTAVHQPEHETYCEEVAALLQTGGYDSTRVVHAAVATEISGLIGSHARIEQGTYHLEYNDFMVRLATFEGETVPRFESYQACKQRVVDEAREGMRLEEFTPRVLTSFVRNKLIDQVYLPIVGDNLAKQIGVVGANKRTDLMGLLLLISPPGYGKTTLMEYIANRLGIIFMKINGPAIGHRVTSIDPGEAPNAAAREELNKLGLALEMGDNVMIYLDDIQHCNPELLQKFISLCDGQRRIEGVYKGKTCTYDLRGKKVAVVMAGNPYTESGEAFQIPDMLANRADTYNLGDIIGDSAEAFKLSYLENSLTSNSTLNQLASRNVKDIYGLIRIAETDSREGVELESNYTAEEITEFTGVLKKLLRVRDVILNVNLQYIASAAQADEYRVEPPFKLQGSYRNMNRIAEKVLPIMNDEELDGLIVSHYENEAQTLTTGTEANLLKFKQLNEIATTEELDRWEDICRTFKKNLSFQGVGSDDATGQVVVQLANFSEGLDKIRNTLTKGIETWVEVNQSDGLEEIPSVETIFADSTLNKLGSMLKKLKPAPPPPPPPAKISEMGPREMTLTPETLESLAGMFKELVAAMPAPSAAPAVVEGGAPAAPMAMPKVEVVNKVPRGMLHVMQQQSKLLADMLTPLLERSVAQGVKLEDLQTHLDSTMLAYKNLIRTIDRGNKKH